MSDFSKSGKRARPEFEEDSSDSDIEIVETKKQRGVPLKWTLAEDKALSALMEEKELDMDDRADAMAAQGFLKRSANALEHRWGRIKYRKLTPEEEQKMEAKERKLAAKKAKKNSEQERKTEAKERDAVANQAKKNIGPANGNKDTTSPFTLEEEGALVAIHNNVVEKASQSPYGKPDYDWDKIEVAMAEMAAETGKGSPRSKEVLQREMARLVGRKVELGRAQERLKQVEKKAEDKDLMKKLGI